MLKSKHKRRDQITIIATILWIAKEGILKTQIMYGANLSFTQLNYYIPLLLNHSLLTQADVEGKEGYITTVKGIGFVQRHQALLQMISPNLGIRKTKTLP